MDRQEFLSHVKKENSHWLWQDSLTWNGYGILKGGKMAHRRAYELWIGPIEAGKVIDHLCRVRTCVRPRHLET